MVTTCLRLRKTPPRCLKSRHSEIGLTHAAALSQLPLLPEELRAQKHLFPSGCLDQDLQQLDLRERNSWRLTLAEVPSVELLRCNWSTPLHPSCSTRG